MRILVTGSRTWIDPDRLERELAMACIGTNPREVTIVHGDCPKGADRMASVWVRRFGSIGVTEERHPADWGRHDADCPPRHHRKFCSRAGFRRNAEMVAAGADLCLAFIRAESRGATHCADLAEKAGIPVRRYTA